MNADHRRQGDPLGAARDRAGSTSPARARTASVTPTAICSRSSRSRAQAGLGVTIHVGEEGGDAGIEEIGEVIETLRPDRIGHGILAARDPELMETLRATEIVLEICPTSNLLTKALESEEALRETFRAFTRATGFCSRSRRTAPR